MYITPNDPRYIGADDSASIQNAVNAAAASDTHIVRIPRRCERTGKDV